MPSPLAGELRLEGVSFAYPGSGTAVLSSISLEVRPGESLAVVSTSGGGKTTLARLLVRFLDPTDGTIRLDGEDLRELDLESLRRAVTVVEQEPFVLGASLLDNLRYGSWDVPRERALEAAKRAGLESFVATSPGDLDVLLEEGGANLSGGQKQRIALARAVLRDPRVLVLDEATSALDGETEALVFSSLEAWLRERTVVVMAHRLATVARFSRIVVLDRGGVVGDGSLPDLVRSCRPFLELFGDQLESVGREPPLTG